MADKNVNKQIFETIILEKNVYKHSNEIRRCFVPCEFNIWPYHSIWPHCIQNVHFKMVDLKCKQISIR